MTDGITEAVMFTKRLDEAREKIQPNNSDFNVHLRLDDSNDFVTCPKDGSRLAEGKCAYEDICSGYYSKCPSYNPKE